jgi:hypothetical protein
VKLSEIIGKIAVQYGRSCVTQRKVYEWSEKCKEIRTSFDNALCRRLSIIAYVKIAG